MLRNRCGWAWRLCVAILCLFFFESPTARGGPLTGLPPVLPVIPSTPSPQSSFLLSGYVYDDPTDQGVMQSGDSGLPAVQITINGTGALAYSSTAYTNSAGYYVFGGLVAGDS